MGTNNNSNNSSVNHLSFAGTILAGSYMSFFIVPKCQGEENNKGINNDKLKVTPYHTPDIFWDMVIPCIRDIGVWKFFWDIAKDGFKSLTKETELEKTKEEFNSFITTLNNNFDNYKEKHESCLNDLVKDIDNINRQKTLMKDYLLKKLYKKLKNMGIECSFSDFIVEHIDLRNFPINENYDLVKKRNLSTIENTNNTLEEVINIFLSIASPLYFIDLRFSNSDKIKKIKQLKENLNNEAKHNTEMMIADIKLIKKLECALKNIANIYNDLMDKLMPEMEKILDELPYKYMDIYQMPIDKMNTLRGIKDLLKDLSEVNIVPNISSIENMEAEVVMYSNSLSMKHKKLQNATLLIAS